MSIEVKLNDGRTLTGYSYESSANDLKVRFLTLSLEELKAVFTDEIAVKKIEIEGAVFENYKTDYLKEYTGGIKEVGMIRSGSAEDEAVYAAAIELAKIQAAAVDDETAVKVKELYEHWSGTGKEYKKDMRLQYNGKLYKVLMDHTSQADWTPDTAVSLYVSISDPAEEWPAWVQPVGAEDAYQAGDKVSHTEKHWTSDVNANVWEPGVYGWSEVTD